jgi:Ca-activated chloride channel family protein
MSRPAFVLQIICGFLLGSALAQDARVSITPGEPRLEFAKDSGGRIRVDTDLVLVPVLVTDADDHLVTGLDRSNFKIFDDNVEQEIRHFSIEDAPVSVGLLFDISGSMAEKMVKARMAASEFLKASNPDDELALIAFNDRARLLTPFTNEFGEIENRIGHLEARGRTALLDAVGLALNEMKHAHNTRKALLIISDGGDNCSRHHEREIRRRVREADVQIYSIGILDSFLYRSRTLEEADGPRLLNEIATQTGGRLFEIDDPNDLPEVASRIGRALRNQYVLGYSPSQLKRDGKYHRITVTLAPPEGSPKMRASFRSSYLAPSQ